MTFIEKFEQIKKKFGKLDTSRVSEDFAVQINLTDEDCGGAFFVAYQDGVAAIEPSRGGEMMTQGPGQQEVGWLGASRRAAFHVHTTLLQ